MACGRPGVIAGYGVCVTDYSVERLCPSNSEVEHSKEEKKAEPHSVEQSDRVAPGKDTTAALNKERSSSRSIAVLCRTYHTACACVCARSTAPRTGISEKGPPQQQQQHESNHNQPTIARRAELCVRRGARRTTFLSSLATRRTTRFRVLA